MAFLLACGDQEARPHVHTHVSVDTCPPRGEDKPEGSLRGDSDDRPCVVRPAPSIQPGCSARQPWCPRTWATASCSPGRPVSTPLCPLGHGAVPRGRPAEKGPTTETQCQHRGRGDEGKRKQHLAPQEATDAGALEHRPAGWPAGVQARCRPPMEVAVSAQDTQDVSVSVPSPTSTPTRGPRAGAGPSPRAAYGPQRARCQAPRRALCAPQGVTPGEQAWEGGNPRGAAVREPRLTGPLPGQPRRTIGSASLPAGRLRPDAKAAATAEEAASKETTGGRSASSLRWGLESL